MLAFGAINAETPRALPPLRAPQTGFNFPLKRTLNYAVDWRVFPAGIASFHQETDGNLERVSVTADTTGAVNLLFRVTDRFQSTFNRETGCSQTFSKQLVEGRRKVNSEMTVRLPAQPGGVHGEESRFRNQPAQAGHDSCLRDGFALSDLLRRFAAHDGGRELSVSAGRRRAKRSW